MSFSCTRTQTATASRSARVDFRRRCKMPKINYSRAALVQHCIDTSRECLERATRILDRVVRQQADFLVPYALVSLGDYTTVSLPVTPRLLARFKAERWIAAHVKMYGTRFEQATSALYFCLLARAALLTPSLEIAPATLWQNAAFLDSFRRQATTLLTNRNKPLARHNFAALRGHPVAGSIMADIEHRIPSEIERYTQLYSKLLEAIEYGLPPVTIARRFLSDAELREYERLLQSPPADLDIVSALSNGEARQQRGHGTWNAHDTRKSMELLAMLARGQQRGDRKDVIGEEYERHMQAETRRRNERERDRIATAQRLGTWRIRKADFTKWHNALSADEWSLYLRCEHAMRTVLPAGVVTRIQRRHFNPTSVQDMRNTNLANLCKQLLAPSTTNEEEEAGAAERT